MVIVCLLILHRTAMVFQPLSEKVEKAFSLYICGRYTVIVVMHQGSIGSLAYDECVVSVS